MCVSCATHATLSSLTAPPPGSPPQGVATGLTDAITSHAITQRIEYTGEVYRRVQAVADLPSGGQVGARACRGRWLWGPSSHDPPKDTCPAGPRRAHFQELKLSAAGKAEYPPALLLHTCCAATQEAAVCPFAPPSQVLLDSRTCNDIHNALNDLGVRVLQVC